MLPELPSTDPAPLAWHARVGGMLPALAILGALAVGIAANSSLRRLLIAALANLTPTAVLIVLPVQAVAIILCSLALWTLKPGVSAMACFASRLLRDAGNGVLLILPGLGEAIGTRVMVLAGGRTRAALSVRALDILAETLGQLPYMAIAFFVLARVWRRVGLPAMAWPGWQGLVITGVLACLTVSGGAIAWRWARGPGRHTRFIRHLTTEYQLITRELRHRRSAIPFAVLVHAIAWGLSGVQIWLAARALHLPLSFEGAIALESAASTTRVLLFFVPGGIAAQEAGMVGAGLAFGLAAPASLALALIFRLRDAIFGLALLWWPVMEARVKRGPRT